MDQRLKREDIHTSECPNLENSRTCEAIQDIEKQVRTEIVLPAILDQFRMVGQERLSFSDVQLVLKEYLERNWNIDVSNRGRSTSKLCENDVYLLLNIEGQLSMVFNQTFVGKSLFIDSCRELSDVFNWKSLYCYHKYWMEKSITSGWNAHLPKNLRLYSLGDIYPQHTIHSSFLARTDAIQGLELGNECLSQLRKTGYLSDPSFKEYIKA